MNFVLRPGRPEDALACGSICYEAFKTISGQHNYPPDFPHPEAGIGLMNQLLAQEGVYAVVAEADGQILGSNFLWEGDHVAGIGPITVDPQHQNASVGKALMEKVLQRVEERQFASVRLVQSAYHNRSLSLYTKLGFDVQEPLSCIQGTPPGISLPGYAVRAATEGDRDACNQLCFEVHGHSRRQELEAALQSGTARVVEHNGTITGYTTQVAFFGHSVARTNNELKALIGSAGEYGGPGFLLPSRNSGLFRWCLNQGLKVVQPMSLMSKGLYNEPKGSFLPSVLF
jgi:predicted N-acetyltransferase YhbS